MTRDGVAMVRFLYWLENAVKSGTETELSIDQKLYEFRSAQENFQGISFDTWPVTRNMAQLYITKQLKKLQQP